MSKNLTDVFASTLYELANSEFPAEVVREARLCLLDFLGPILGDDEGRIDMSGGISPDSDALDAAPILIKEVEEDVLRVHVLMLGGGPAIRGITHRIFHKHDVQVVLDEIVTRAKDATKLLGCTPTALAIGVGRSQFEATALMMEAMV